MSVVVTKLDDLDLIVQGLEHRFPVGDSEQAIRWAIAEIRRLRAENERLKGIASNSSMTGCLGCGTPIEIGNFLCQECFDK